VYLSRDSLEKVREGLMRLAETRNPNAAVPPKVTRPQLVRILRRESATALRMEYEVEDVLGLFSQHGVELDSRTFREYWRQLRKKKGAGDSAVESNDRPLVQRSRHLTCA
jgi:hypothetical protein